MTEIRIPFNRPHHLGREQTYMADALARGHASGDGHYSARCAALLEEALGARKVLLTPSCTSALELALMTLGVGPGDEVILPAFTFVAGANAAARCGARPVFCDIRSDTLNLDEARLPDHLGDATRVVMPTHYAGVGCEMEAILELAAKHHSAVVEDAAHAMFGRRNGAALGTLGALSVLSFHETKNFTCGEGGALIVNDPDLIEKAVVIRHGGTNRAAFLAGKVDRYTWITPGSKMVLSDLLAAFLLAQLEARDEIQRRRMEIWTRYLRELESWAAANQVRLPTVPMGCEPTAHMFHLILPTKAARDALIETLGRQGILAVFHFQPLHLSPWGRELGGREGDCPVTEDLSQRLVRLPLYTGLTDNEQAQVIEAATSLSC